MIPLDDDPFKVPVIGGAGAFRHASGFLRVHPKDDDARLVFQLQP